MRGIDPFAVAEGATTGATAAVSHHRQAGELHVVNNSLRNLVRQELHQVERARVIKAKAIWANPCYRRGQSQANTHGLRDGRRGNHRDAGSQRPVAGA